MKRIVLFQRACQKWKKTTNFRTLVTELNYDGRNWKSIIISAYRMMLLDFELKCVQLFERISKNEK